MENFINQTEIEYVASDTDDSVACLMFSSFILHLNLINHLIIVDVTHLKGYDDPFGKQSSDERQQYLP